MVQEALKTNLDERAQIAVFNLVNEVRAHPHAALIAAGAAAITTTASAVTDAAGQVDGLLPILTRIVTDHWPLLIVGALLVGAIILSGRIKRARVSDARTGANLSR